MGKWIRVEDRQPTEYGRYPVLVKRKMANTPDSYLWNGSYWVTPNGNPSRGVIQWYDKEADGDE